jgi:hypothetical protein
MPNPSFCCFGSISESYYIYMHGEDDFSIATHISFMFPSFFELGLLVSGCNSDMGGLAAESIQDAP